MRAARPRPQILALLALAALAVGGLTWAWVSGLGAGGVSSNGLLFEAVEGSGMGHGEQESLVDLGAQSAVAEAGALSGPDLPSVIAGADSRISDRVAAGPRRLEYRITLLVSDGSNGQPVPLAAVTDVLWRGEPLTARSEWQTTEASDEGLIEVVCRLPETAEAVEGDLTPVSYTHLTLPTILLV